MLRVLQLFGALLSFRVAHFPGMQRVTCLRSDPVSVPWSQGSPQCLRQRPLGCGRQTQMTLIFMEGWGPLPFLPDLGSGLADAVSSTHSVGFGSVLDLKWKPRAQTERRPSRKSLAYFKKSQIFKPSLHSLK